uniref:Uncharacterized protein n=1 Tax=Arundo donax TaxID=35708 RepID=A0A0A9H9Z5_ARUDO
MKPIKNNIKREKKKKTTTTTKPFSLK